MTPYEDILLIPIEEASYSNKTYRIDTNSNRISGKIDDLESIIQTIYLILNTERYAYIIYSWDYGVELNDLYGKPMPYVRSEIQRRITEALTQDNRITSVENFEFTTDKRVLHVTFDVVTTAGIVHAERDVSLN